MPAPPHPGRGGGPGKGPPLHRCCRPRTAGAVLGVEVGAQGHDQSGIQEQKTAMPGLCSLERTGEGGLRPGPIPQAPLAQGVESSPAQQGAWVLLGVAEGLGWKMGHQMLCQVQ